MYTMTIRQFFIFRVGIPKLNTIVGASNPEISRKDIQEKLYKQLCNSCKNGPSCKLHNNCEVCENWCGSEELSGATPEAKSIVGLQLRRSPAQDQDNIVGSPLRKNTKPLSSITKPQSQDPFVLTTRSNFADFSEKKQYNLEPTAIQPMKGAIMRLLGISNTADIDGIGVWVSTISNKPPSLVPKNNAETILKFCKDAGSELQEEAKNGAKEMVAFMWAQLQKDLEKKFRDYDKSQLNKDEAGKLVQDFFKEVCFIYFIVFGLIS